MSPATSDKSIYDGLSKKDRQALNRELNRIKREEERKRRKRNRIILVTSLIVAALAVIAIVGLVVFNSIRATFVGPANMLSDGILFTGDGTNVTATKTAAIQPDAQPVANDLDTSTVLRMTEYVDYSSPDVATFETTNGASLQSYVSAGYASLELHPVALEGADSYAGRAANAVACVANTVPDAVLAVHNSLVTAQKTLPDGGLSNDDLVGLVETAGVKNDTVSSCIRGNDFSDWVTDATDRAKASIPNSDVTALSTVPLLVVDGTAYTGALDDADALSTFITDVFTAASGGADAGDDGSGADGAGTDGSGTDGAGTTGDGAGTTDGTGTAPTDGTGTDGTGTDSTGTDDGTAPSGQ